MLAAGARQTVGQASDTSTAQHAARVRAHVGVVCYVVAYWIDVDKHDHWDVTTPQYTRHSVGIQGGNQCVPVSARRPPFEEILARLQRMRARVAGPTPPMRPVVPRPRLLIQYDEAEAQQQQQELSATAPSSSLERARVRVH